MAPTDWTSIKSDIADFMKICHEDVEKIQIRLNLG
jgi:hypothetical protein